MRKLYRGKIGRLIIFAAPSGAGKTSFLNNPKALLTTDALPAQISDLYDLAPKHKNIMHLKKNSRPNFEQLCMHVDLTQPIRRLKPTPNSREQLLSAIEPRIFSEWRELKSYTERASEIHVITLFVRREEHFRRWTNRALKKNPTSWLRKTMTIVNGDSTNESELHRKVYRSWQDFVKTMSARSCHIIDGNGANYSFLSQCKYESEINTAYQT